VWGLLGSSYARFSSFVTAPSRLLSHLRDLQQGRAHRHRGHNPLGGIMILATIAVCYVIYGVAAVAATLPWYLSTVRRDEQLYLSNSQNISGSQTDGHEIHEIYGCETLPCTEQNTVTFRVRATWFNEVWSILHHGSLFYPGYVAAAVSPVLNRCVITSYGVRKKFLVRSWELYPELIQVECTPTDAGESKAGKVIDNKDYR